MAQTARVMIRLSPEIYAQLEARGSSGQPLAAIVRHALVQYLAQQPEQPEQPDTLRATVDALRASLHDLQLQVDALTTRMDALTTLQQPAAATEQLQQPRAAAQQPEQPATAASGSAQQPPRQRMPTHYGRPGIAPDNGPCTVAALAARLPASRWYRRRVSEGTKGPIVYAFARQRVTLCKDGVPERTVWLVIKRTVGAEPIFSYYISNAPASTPLRTFVWLSGLRWAIEPCLAEGKTELGMDHYEVLVITQNFVTL